MRYPQNDRFFPHYPTQERDLVMDFSSGSLTGFPPSDRYHGQTYPFTTPIIK